MALYNATDGPNWLRNENWGSAMPLNTWYGVTTDGTGRVIRLNLYDYANTGGSNNLNGILPNEIGDLTALENFAIGANPDLTGPIPDSFGNLINLTTIFLSQNSLSGPLPDSLGNLVNLTDIRLTSNAFTGEIPATFANLLQLERLAIFRNDMSGIVPPFLGTLVNLRVLDLGENNFEGDIPQELENLADLYSLDLSSNRLSGTIPETFGNLTNLVYLILNNNEQLVGTLPNSLSQLTNLAILNVSACSLEGAIPTIAFDPSLSNSSFRIRDNSFQFGDFEDDFEYYSTTLNFFEDTPQNPVNERLDLTACLGEDITLTTTVSGSANVYEWFRDGVPIPSSNVADLVIDNFQNVDEGVYTCIITSMIVTDLVLERNPIRVTTSSATPVANPVDDLYACDTDNDGFADFDIDIPALEAQILGNQTGLTVSYFDEDGNPLTLTNPYTNTTANTQVVLARVGGSNCFDEIMITLIVNSGIVADTGTDVTDCSYVLPVLSANNFYYTASNKGGDLLSEGAVLSTSQTIYIYAENGDSPNLCFDESSFTFTLGSQSTECQNNEITGLPKFFTPNNDGANDTWDISGLASTGNVEVLIFDRYGKFLQQLNSSNNYQWNGNHNGYPLPSNDYWYKYVEPNTGRVVNGHFTLKR